MYNGPDILQTDRQSRDRKRHTDRLRQRLGGRQVNRLTELIKKKKNYKDIPMDTSNIAGGN